MGMSKQCFYFLFFFFFSAQLFGQEDRYMVFFKDKASTPFSTASPELFLSQKSIQRRSRQGLSVSEMDLPVDPAYVNQVKAIGAKIKYSSKWFNGTLIEGTPQQKDLIAAMPFVQSVEFVAPGKTGTGGRLATHSKFANTTSSNEVTQIQNSILGLDEMQNAGFTGEGVLIAVLDSGFPNVNTNPAFAHLISEQRIKDSYNFSYGHANAFTGHPHGAQVLSIIAAKLPSSFTGGAYDANFLLYATEYTPNEYRVEEFNWTFAAERADSVGADIITSSLGYGYFDDPSMDYTSQELNGETAVISQAANFAFERGIVVVNSVGNLDSPSWQEIAPPADSENILSVGSIDVGYKRSNGSAFGPTSDGRMKPDVMAVGVNSAYVSTAGTVSSGSGTSYACPMITSLVAGVYQSWPELSAKEMVDLIREAGSHYFNPTNDYGFGVPTFKAVQNIMDFIITDPGILAYPNPVVDKLKIAMVPNDGHDVFLTLLDNLGNVVERFQYASNWNFNPFTLDMSSYSAGVYILKVSSKSTSSTKKIIKN
jgi:serine protease AprX